MTQELPKYEKRVKNIFKNLLNSLFGLITIDSIKKQLTPLLTC